MVSRLILLLLLADLLPLGGQAHPLKKPSQDSAPPEEPEKQVSLLQAEEIMEEQPVAPEFQVAGMAVAKFSRSSQAGKAEAQKVQPKRKNQSSSCFGRKLDRIHFSTNLGCNSFGRN